MGTVLLVRHAETTWNREGRVQGWAPTTLSDRGREQARSLARVLTGNGTREDAGSEAPVAAQTVTVGAADWSGANVDRVVTSDLRRARETARAIETATGCQPTVDAGWRERNMGRLQGLPASELFDRYPHLSVKDGDEDAANARPEGGETLTEVRQRVLDAWDRLRAELAADETAVVVSHSGPISLLLGDVENDSLTEAVLDRTPDNCAVSELHVDGDDARLVRENWTAYRQFVTQG